MSLESLQSLLLVVLALPAVSGALVALLGRENPQTARQLAFLASLTTLVLAWVVIAPISGMLGARHIDLVTFQPLCVPGDPGVAIGSPTGITAWDLIPFSFGSQPAAVQFYLGLDGLNIWLVLLTCLLFPSVILLAWNSIAERSHEFFAWLLVLETTVIGVFLSFDIVLFYVFFELTLVPLFFLIGIWGGPAKREAARTFILYTLAGSLITLLGVLMVIAACYEQTKILTFSIPQLIEQVRKLPASSFWYSVQFWFFLAMVTGFAVKIPLAPVHTWLPLTYTEAPIPVTVLLSGILAKLGTYGIVRLCLPLAPDAAVQYGLPILGTIAVIGIIYGAMCAYAQDDLKRLVAYSSVSHLGFCVLGLAVMNVPGVTGGVLHMINHGLSTGAMFVIVGLIADRYHTRSIKGLGGLMTQVPTLTFFMIVICLASVGLPGLNNFVSEALMLLGLFQIPGTYLVPWVALAAGIGIALGAWYTMTMVRNVFFGPTKSEISPTDLNGREFAAVAPLAILCLFLGLFPQQVIESMKYDVRVVTRLADDARNRAKVLKVADRPSDEMRAEAK